MQMGHMRFEPNINVHITDGEGNVHKTAITEIKNLNSFNVLEKATTYEINRQVHQWIDTGSLGKKSTYGWDAGREETFHQRDKEDAQDYRYFPDPDLVPVEVDDVWLSELKSQIGELPAARRKRYIEAVGLEPDAATTLASDKAIADYFDDVVSAGADARRVSNFILTQGLYLAKTRNKPLPKLGITAARFAKLVKLVEGGALASSMFAPVIDKMVDSEADPEQVLDELGLRQVNDTSAIDVAIDALIAQNPQPLQDFKAGKQAALGALVGMIMKTTKGLNPKIVQQRLREKVRWML
jgi:aspartyl-tRNA(Asn)/glutamyl-tRNA(Gln) amidotransferase subunit B